MRIVKMESYALGVLVGVLSMAAPAMAGVTIRTQEIDGASFSAGLGLLAAGILVLRARRAR